MKRVLKYVLHIRHVKNCDVFTIMNKLVHTFDDLY